MVRARSFGSIRKLPSGRYQARYWHLGKQISAEHTFVNKTDARRWLSTVEADLVRGDWVDPAAGKVTFGEYADWWIEQRRFAHARGRSTKASCFTSRRGSRT